MNERIKELAVQAGASVSTIGGVFVNKTNLNIEKFAELIGQKCLTIADKEHKLALEFEWDNDDTAQSIKDSIKKHFGVEE